MALKRLLERSKMEPNKENLAFLNEVLDSVIIVLTEYMIKDSFKSKGKKEKKYIVSTQQLYSICIKLIKDIKKVYIDD